MPESSNKNSNPHANMYFFMKPMIKNNKVAPFLYTLLQAVVLLPIVSGHFTSSSRDKNPELIFLGVWTLMTFYYYLRTAWTNPGYLQGSAADEAKRAGAYDPKMYHIEESMDNRE